MATNNGESKIKTNLEADLLLKDGGTIQAMLGKVKQLHTEITKLSDGMQKVMGSASGTSGFVKQLQEAASLMREMKQNAHALGQATANPTAAARNTLISGAAAAGQLQGLKDVRTAEEKLYQQRVAQGKVNINTLLKETDARKLALAQEGLLLRSQTARLSKSREIAAKQLEALKGELQLRKEVAAKTKTADAARFAYERKFEAAEAKARTQSAQATTGRQKMSAYTTENLPDERKLRKWHPSQLNALAQGQTQRQMAAIGRGDTKTQQDATAILWSIKGLQDEAKAKRQARAAIRQEDAKEEKRLEQERGTRLAGLRQEAKKREQAQKETAESQRKVQGWVHSEQQKLTAAQKKERDTAHGEALREAKQRRTDYQNWWKGAAGEIAEQEKHHESLRRVGGGRELPATAKDLQQIQGTLLQKASIVDVARASNEKLIPTLANVAKATDLVWLQEEKRYAGIRKRLGGEDAKKEEQARINAIRVRIKELAKEEKQTNISTAALHAQNAAAGRLRMSQHTLGTITPLLPTMSDHDLRSLTQGQRARDLAGQGMGTARGDGISKDAQAALDAIKKEQDARKDAANKQIADDKRVAANNKKLQEDGAKVELDADAKRRRNTRGTVDEIKATRDLADAKRKHSVAEATRIADIAKNNKVTVDGIKEIKHLHDINDQLAASRHRQRATQSQAEKQAEVDLQQLLRLRAQELNKLHRQDKAVESDADRAARLDMARRNTRERLFGDGGANTMIVQAGLMANYQVLGGLQSLLSGAASSAIEFDKALKQVQAVSAATRNEMVDLRQSLIEVAQSSRFSAAEVAQASVLLAQAGLSVKEIQQTMAATISLATASGSELKKSVDVMTSVLSVFDMGADKSTDVANKLTAALNMSKLDIDKMALGLQYAGNAAADAGVTFDELVSTLSAMANAGIRSGSTLGTGNRQLFVELQKPSENFKRVLDRLGIGMSQIDIKAQGFEGVLRNLQEQGFTTGDAFQSFQIRAASAFAALSNNINVFHDMQDAIEGTNAAMEANEIQMESLAVQYDHLKSNLGIVAAEGFAPVLAATRDTVKMFAHFFEGAEKGSASLKVAFTALSGAALAVTAAVSLNMLVGLVKLGGGMGALFRITAATVPTTKQLATQTTLLAEADTAAARAAFYLAEAETAVAAGATESAIALRASAASAMALSASLNAAAANAVKVSFAMKLMSWTPVLLGVGLLITAFISFGKESEKLNEELDKARTKMDGFAEANSKSQQTIENVDEAINTLSTRYARLSENSQELDGFVKELANQFKEQGLTVDNLAGKSIKELIERLGELREELSTAYIINIREEGKSEVEAIQLAAKKDLATAKEKADFLNEGNLATAELRTQARRIAAGAEIATEPGMPKGGDFSLAQRQTLATKAVAATAGYPLRQQELLTFLGYPNVDALRAELFGIKNKPGVLLPDAERANRRLEVLDFVDRSQLGGKREIAARKRSDIDQRVVEQTTARHADVKSGYVLANTVTQELSVADKADAKNGASLAQLRGFDTRIKAKEAVLDAEREALEARKLDLNDEAKLAAIRLELTELAQVRSTLMKKMEPLIKEEKLQLEDKAKYELEDAEKEVKRIEKQIKDEKNINLLTDGMADKLAAARRVLGQKRIEALVAEKTRAGDSPARIAMAKARLEKEIKHELDTVGPFLNDAKDALIKENKDFDQKLGKDALTAPFKEIDKQLDNFDTNLKGLLDERSGSVSAKVRQLKQRIQDNRLAGAGIATSGDLYGPKALGRNNDLADLSFRRRAGAQFRSAALGKELQKAQVEEAKIKVSAIDVELPKLLALQDTHQTELEKLKGSRDASRAELDKLIAQQVQAEKDKTSLSPAFADKKKQAYEDWKVMADVYDAQEKQANNIKDKIYGLEDTKGNLLDTLGNQEGKFQMWIDALKTGVEGLTQSFSDMFQRIVTGTGDTEEAFREMGRGILASMLQVISNKISQQFMEMAMGFIGNALMPSPVTAGPSSMGVEAGARLSRTGGPIHRRAGGGYVPGSVARDAVPTLLMPGEFVLQKSASAALGEDFLHGLNRTTGATMRQGAERAAKAAAPAAPGEPSSVNVWVVTPDQQTGMSKDDIIVTVGDNIARNGSIRKLIKQVQVGG